MASITPVWRNRDAAGAVARRGARTAGALWWLVLGAGTLLSLLSAPNARADEFRVTEAETRLVDQVYLLDASIALDLSGQALDALANGVPLTVRLDIAVERQRRWLWDEEIARLQQHYELSYHAFSRQYLVRNLNSGGVYTFPALDSALASMGELRGFPLLDAKLLDPDERYEGNLRAYLDIEALPSPLRPIAYISQAWRLGSGWHQWSLTP